MAEMPPATGYRRRAIDRCLAGGIVAALLLVSVTSVAAGDETERVDSRLSRAGEFRVSYASKLTPIVINRIHDWVVHVETAAGSAVADARISVAGGMPEHNHGLPTQPRVTNYLGNGDYLVEGLRFHMNGFWELYFTIDTGDVRDTVVVPLTL